MYICMYIYIYIYIYKYKYDAGGVEVVRDIWPTILKAMVPCNPELFVSCTGVPRS